MHFYLLEHQVRRDRRKPMTKIVPQRALLGVALGLALSALAWGQPAPGADALTRASQLVFRGTVVKVGAANLAAVQDPSGTAVVRVDEVWKAPGRLGDFTGREITVQLQKAGAALPGEQAVFFANGWLVGETLAVVETGRLHGDPVALKAQVAAAARQSDLDQLKGRLAEAELVVAGRVVATHKATASGRTSEHDPEWWEAEIQVDAVYKGKPAGPRVSILYPKSPDVTWYGAPKPSVGWDGIWLLSRRETELAGGAYTALKPDDLLGRDQAATVQQLLGH
jgi:hypothetical protein